MAKSDQRFNHFNGRAAIRLGFATHSRQIRRPHRTHLWKVSVAFTDFGVMEHYEWRHKNWKWYQKMRKRDAIVHVNAEWLIYRLSAVTAALIALFTLNNVRPMLVRPSVNGEQWHFETSSSWSLSLQVYREMKNAQDPTGGAYSAPPTPLAGLDITSLSGLHLQWLRLFPFEMLACTHLLYFVVGQFQSH